MSNSEARELILDLMARDELTQAEIARQLGRSPDMVRLVRTGKRPGHNLVGALRALHEKGTVDFADLPPRRRRKDGKLAAVRGPMSGWKPTPAAEGEKPAPRPTVIPDDPTARDRPKAKRHRFAEQITTFQGGVKKYDFHTPKRADSKGYKEADNALVRALRSVARSQAAKNRVNPQTGKVRGKRVVKFHVTYDNGHRVEIYGKGGQSSSTVLRKIKEAGSVQQWIDAESKKGRPETYTSKTDGHSVVNVEMTSYYQSDQEGGTSAHKKASMFG